MIDEMALSFAEHHCKVLKFRLPKWPDVIVSQIVSCDRIRSRGIEAPLQG